MICRCTTTSSALVGSSAMMTEGLERDRHRDADALLHPAGELVRVLAGDVRAQTDRGQQRRDPLLRLASFKPTPWARIESRN